MTEHEKRTRTEHADNLAVQAAFAAHKEPSPAPEHPIRVNVLPGFWIDPDRVTSVYPCEIAKRGGHAWAVRISMRDEPAIQQACDTQSHAVDVADFISHRLHSRSTETIPKPERKIEPMEPIASDALAERAKESFGTSVETAPTDQRDDTQDFI